MTSWKENLINWNHVFRWIDEINYNKCFKLVKISINSEQEAYFNTTYKVYKYIYLSLHFHISVFPWKKAAKTYAVQRVANKHKFCGESYGTLPWNENWCLISEKCPWQNSLRIYWLVWNCWRAGIHPSCCWDCLLVVKFASNVRWTTLRTLW